MVTSQHVLPLRAVSGSMVMQQLFFVLIFMTYVAIKDHADICGLDREYHRSPNAVQRLPGPSLDMALWRTSPTPHLLLHVGEQLHIQAGQHTRACCGGCGWHR